MDPSKSQGSYLLSLINWNYPPQWKIHDVFHIDLLTPYHETDVHGVNFTQPPPDLVNCYVTVGTFARRGLSSTAKTLRSLSGVRGSEY